jgi:hypothetical protein
MKRIGLGVAVLCAIANIAAAAMSPACVSGTLTSYIALGSGGCFIGNDQISNFQTLSNLAGAQAISPAGVTVTPSGSDANPSLIFDLTSTAAIGAPTEAIFTYQLNANNVTASMITLSGTNVTADGGVTDAQNLCLAGSFGPDGVSGCTGTATSLVALNNGSDQTSFSGVPFLHISDDLTIDAGLDGSASGAHFVDQFTASAAGSAVPEPGMFPALLVSMALVIYCKRKSVMGLVKNI